MSRGNWKKSLVFFAIVTIAMFTLMNNTDFNRKGTTTIENTFKDLLAPLQGGVTNVSQEVSSYFRALFELKYLKDRNETLEDEVMRLRGQLVEMENFRADNLRYRKLLNFKDSNIDNFRLEGARVIARSPENWFNVVTINKGHVHGIRREMVVITPVGLVGHVVSVTDNTAQVLLLLDSRSGVSALLQKSRTPGVVEGMAAVNLVRMKYIPEDIMIEVGETVITSDLGGIFPKGLPIGKVTEFELEPGGLTKRAIVEPFVDFNYLEEVFVIKQVFRVLEDPVEDLATETPVETPLETPLERPEGE